MRVSKISLKGSGKMNEDALVINENLFAVFDGATGLDGYRNKDGKTGGWLAANIAAKEFARPVKNFKINNLEDLMLKANKKIGAAMKAARINKKKKENLWLTTAAAVRIDDQSKNIEFATIGDSLILAELREGGYKLLVPYRNHDVKTLTEWAKRVKAGEKVSLQTMYKQFTEVRRRVNIEYGDLSGEKIAKKFIFSGSIKQTGIKAVCLFTDGLLFPTDHLNKKFDVKKYGDLIFKKGLVKTARLIRSLEKSDPLCRHWARVKQHDDLTAILIKL